jgi:hypothetical protein
MSSQAAFEPALRSMKVSYPTSLKVNRDPRTIGEPRGWSSADAGAFAVDWEIPHVPDETR